MKKGISLVTLVITVIVLIILTSAIIIIFNDGGILGRSEEAVFKNDIRLFQESLLNNILERQMAREIDNKDQLLLKIKYEDVLEYIPIFKQKYENKFVIDKGNIKYIKANLTDKEVQYCKDLGIEEYIQMQIGDSINYEPNSAEQYVLEKDNRMNYQLQPHNQTINRDENISWKVMKIESNGDITLVGDVTDTAQMFQLCGTVDYLYGVEKLNDACEKLYSYEDENGKIYKARNINMNDILELLKINSVENELLPYEIDNRARYYGKPLYYEEIANNTNGKTYYPYKGANNTVSMGDWSQLSTSNWPSDLYVSYYNPISNIIRKKYKDNEEYKNGLSIVDQDNLYWIATPVIEYFTSDLSFGIYFYFDRNIVVSRIYRANNNSNSFYTEAWQTDVKLRPVITLPAHIAARFIED